MKNKRFNILFMMMMICLMFIGVKEVHAEASRYCSYKLGGADFKVKLYFGSDHELETSNLFTAGNSVNLDKIFVIDGEDIYCPQTVFYVADGGGSISYAVRTSGDSSEKATLNVRAGSNVIDYQPVIEKDESGKEQIKVCTTGGKAYLQSAIDSYTLALESDEASLTEEDIRKMTKEERKSMYDSLKALYQKETKTNENGEPVFAQSIINKIEGSCFSFHRDYPELKNKFESTGNEYRAKLENLLTILSKLQVEDGTRTEEEHNDLVETMQADFVRVNSAYSAAFNKVPFSDRVFTCEGLIAEELEAVLQWVLKILRIGAPILVIVLATIDFGQAVMSNDKDALNKATTKVIKRAIAAVALFLVPLLVSVAIDWIDDSNPNMNCTEVIQ